MDYPTAHITNLIPEMWSKILNKKTYFSMQQTSKFLNARLESFLIGSTILNDILSSDVKNAGFDDVFIREFEKHQRVSDRQTPDEILKLDLNVYDTPKNMPQLLIRSLIRTLFSKNHLYNLLILDKKYPGELLSVYKHLDIYVDTDGSIFRLNRRTKTLVYASFNTETDIIFNYEANAGLWLCNYYHDDYKAMQSIRPHIDRTPIILPYLSTIFENALKARPNIILFQNFYRCVIENRCQRAEINNLKRLGFDDAKFPFLFMNARAHKTFFRALFADETLCAHVPGLFGSISQMMAANDKNKIAKYVIQSKNIPLIEHMAKKMWYAHWRCIKREQKRFFSQNSEQNKKIILYIFANFPKETFGLETLMFAIHDDVGSDMCEILSTRVPLNVVKCKNLETIIMRAGRKYNLPIIFSKLVFYFGEDRMRTIFGDLLSSNYLPENILKFVADAVREIL